MKKFLVALLALTMAFSVCGMVSFAEGSTTVTLAAAANPTIADAVTDFSAIEVGDVFEVAVKLADIKDVDAFTSAQIILDWDTTKVEVVDSTGAKATSKAKAFTPNEAAFPSEDEDGEDLFVWKGLTTYDPEKGEINLTTYLSPGGVYSKIGYPLNGATDVELFTVRFKALAEGDSGIDIKDQIVYMGTSKAAATYAPVTITIGAATEPTAIEITAIAPISDVASVEELPDTVVGITDSNDVALTVTWDTTNVGTEAGTYPVTGTVTVPEGYVLAEGVSATITTNVVIPESTEPEPTAVEITAIAPAGDVASVEDLPDALVGTTAEGYVDLTVTWDTTNVGTEAGTYPVTGTVTVPEGYVLAEGVSATVTANVVIPESIEPEPTAIEITAIAPIGDFASVEELPDTVVGITDSNDVALTVTWDTTNVGTEAGTYPVTGTVTVPEGYVLAEGVSATVTTNVVIPESTEPEPEPEPVGPEDVPVAGTVETAPASTGGTLVLVKLALNGDYLGGTDAAADALTDETVYVFFNYMNGNTPISDVTLTTTSVAEIKAGTSVAGTTVIPEGTTKVVFGVVQGVDPNNIISTENLGTAVAVLDPISIAAE